MAIDELSTTINVVEPYLPNYENYLHYVSKIYDSKWLTNNGPLVNKLEKELENYLGVKNLLLVSNGTVAIQLALKLLNCRKNIITTPFSFVATTSAPLWDGYNVKYADIDKDTFNISTKQIESLLDETVDTLLPVHVFGNPCNVLEIDRIATKNNLKVIYDAAHAFGTKVNGNSVLKYGDISTISFHATKLFHSVEGGALVINDDALYKKAKSLINFGYDSGNINDIGINAKMSEFHAAMGLCVLEEIQYINESRKKIYNKYLCDLSKNIITQKINNFEEYNYSYFPAIFKNEHVLLTVLRELNNHKINPRRYFHPSLNKLPYITSDITMPISENISERILCLPIYPNLRESEQEKIINIINNILN